MLKDTIRLYSYLISLTTLRSKKVQNPEKIERRYQNQKKSEVRRKSKKVEISETFPVFQKIWPPWTARSIILVNGVNDDSIHQVERPSIKISRPILIRHLHVD
jgi:hypothetical protein